MSIIREGRDDGFRADRAALPIILDTSSWGARPARLHPIGSAAQKVLAADLDRMAPAHAPLEVLRTIRRYETRDILDARAANQLAAEVIRAKVRLTTPNTAC